MKTIIREGRVTFEPTQGRILIKEKETEREPTNTKLEMASGSTCPEYRRTFKATRAPYTNQQNTDHHPRSRGISTSTNVQMASTISIYNIYSIHICDHI